METLHYHGYEVAYRIAGNPANPCVVCLHPAFGDGCVFEDQFVALQERYFLITLDMLGHGQTQPEKTNDMLDETVEHVRLILDHYQVQQAHLLGVSLGSLVVQGFAHRYGARTASVTAVGGYSIHKHNKALQKAQNKAIGSWILKLLFNMDGFRQYIAREATYSEAAYQRMYSYTQAYTRKSLKYMPGMGKLFVDMDALVDYPLLIVYGEHDLQIALDHGQEWVKLEPKARLEIIKGAGHCANMEMPQAFNAVFEAFIGG
ncbi:MAG: alpha/beta hydrolase [Anaerolineaceae bacterium]|nr:alpha/beta hydrolase [Anaerolineaceae bacterium]